MADVRQLVVQRHDTGQEVHWDLMIEAGQALATWQLPLPPEQITASPVAIRKLTDHPRRFLTYQGPLRNHPGNVTIHDHGTCRIHISSYNEWLIDIVSSNLAGSYRLNRQEPLAAQNAQQAWLIRRESAPTQTTSRHAPRPDDPTRRPYG